MNVEAQIERMEGAAIARGDRIEMGMEALSVEMAKLAVLMARGQEQQIAANRRFEVLDIEHAEMKSELADKSIEISEIKGDLKANAKSIGKIEKKLDSQSDNFWKVFFGIGSNLIMLGILSYIALAKTAA